ncbi:MAG: hypothetical protein DCC75_09240 [Proteobacteria bacterium]|nr:MAG: hypothetical protein DCC75_09240 [Pseudomonadota bacterium]
MTASINSHKRKENREIFYLKGQIQRANNKCERRTISEPPEDKASSLASWSENARGVGQMLFVTRGVLSTLAQYP